jgi:hypothetical protein
LHWCGLEPDLASGALVRLAMPDDPGGVINLSAIYRRDAPPGPAAAELLRQFSGCGAQDAEARGAAAL